MPIWLLKKSSTKQYLSKTFTKRAYLFNQTYKAVKLLSSTRTKKFKSKFVINFFMAAPSLDNEFMQFWLKLTVAEKESLLTVAKHYVHLKEEAGSINIEQYNKELDEAMKRMDAGEYYTHEQVVEMAKDWLNDRKENQLG